MDMKVTAETITCAQIAWLREEAWMLHMAARSAGRPNESVRMMELSGACTRAFSGDRAAHAMVVDGWNSLHGDEP